MLKKTITYTDFNGNQQTEDFYFNLSKAELAELELGTEGGFGEYIQKVVDSNNGKEIIENFKRIIRLAYGRRSEDGKFFNKSEAISNEFFASNAYSELFMEILTDADKGAEFITGLVPEDVAETAGQPQKTETSTVELPPTKPQEMSREELLAAFMKKNQENLGKSNLQ